MTVLGIDFGAAKAGTTVLCWHDSASQKICFAQSVKGADADTFILGCINRVRPQLVAIDAPLSIPLVYAAISDAQLEDDFMFRDCDRQLKAMSPLFLGGLTARAMRISTRLKQQAIKCIEVYPAFETSA
jgi:predicted nuclease with RNAse H fold